MAECVGCIGCGGPDCAEVTAEQRARAGGERQQGGLTAVPSKGRFVVYDGKVHRIKDMWIEQTAKDREKWGVVIWKEGS